MKTITPYLLLMRLDKPIGTLLLLWPMLIALWLATNGQPDLHTSVIFVLGVIIMRAAGCVINDIADRNFDKHVSRTKNRPLAQGLIPTPKAIALFIFLLFIAVALVAQLHKITIATSMVAVLLVILYPFCKRFTFYPQVILGMAFAWSIPMIYVQVNGQINMEAFCLYISILAWVVGYDTQYAMIDKQDDLKIGIKSTAIAFANYDKVIIFTLQLLALAGLTIIGINRNLAWPFYLGIGAALALTVYQQWLIKERDPAKCLAAFLNNNYFGVVIFMGLFFSA